MSVALESIQPYLEFKWGTRFLWWEGLTHYRWEGRKRVTVFLACSFQSFDKWKRATW